MSLQTFILRHFSNSGSDVTQRVIRVAGQYRTPSITSIDFAKYFVYVCWDSSNDLKPLVESLRENGIFISKYLISIQHILYI